MGENLRVSCSAVGEQDVVVEFTWEYPGQQVRPLEGERCSPGSTWTAGQTLRERGDVGYPGEHPLSP